jgi:hypothetical protein
MACAPGLRENRRHPPGKPKMPLPGMAMENAIACPTAPAAGTNAAGLGPAHRRSAAGGVWQDGSPSGGGPSAISRRLPWSQHRPTSSSRRRRIDRKPDPAPAPPPRKLYRADCQPVTRAIPLPRSPKWNGTAAGWKADGLTCGPSCLDYCCCDFPLRSSTSALMATSPIAAKGRHDTKTHRATCAASAAVSIDSRPEAFATIPT